MSSSATTTPERGESSLKRIANLIKCGKAKNVVVLTGAGISTSAGIPDFRSPETGLYANLEKLNLPFPEAVFELNYFRKNPKPFWTLAKDLYPGKYYPTPAHYFLRLLHTNGVLRRVFSQNIDTLETLAGLPPSHVIEAHGSFATAHCLSCRREISREYVLEAGVREGKTVRCQKCQGLVKPDIVFFGEALPERFFSSISDLKQCDLLIIIGTSLQVHPFASLPNYVPSSCPRILINREAVGPFARLANSRSSRPGQGLKDMLAQLYGAEDDSDDEQRDRDTYWGGDADDGCRRLAEELGWGEELDRAIQEGTEELEKMWNATPGEEAPAPPPPQEDTGKGTKEAERAASKKAEEIKAAVLAKAPSPDDNEVRAKDEEKEEKDGWSSDEEPPEAGKEGNEVDKDAVDDLNDLIASQLKLREGEPKTEKEEEVREGE